MYIYVSHGASIQNNWQVRGYPGYKCPRFRELNRDGCGSDCSGYPPPVTRFSVWRGATLLCLVIPLQLLLIEYQTKFTCVSSWRLFSWIQHTHGWRLLGPMWWARRWTMLLKRQKTKSVGTSRLSMCRTEFSIYSRREDTNNLICRSRK